MAPACILYGLSLFGLTFFQTSVAPESVRREDGPRIHYSAFAASAIDLRTMRVDGAMPDDDGEDSLMEGALIGGGIGAYAGLSWAKGMAGLGDTTASRKQEIVGAIMGAALGASIGAIVDASISSE